MEKNDSENGLKDEKDNTVSQNEINSLLDLQADTKEKELSDEKRDKEKEKS